MKGTSVMASTASASFRVILYYPALTGYNLVGVQTDGNDLVKREIIHLRQPCFTCPTSLFASFLAGAICNQVQMAPQLARRLWIIGWYDDGRGDGMAAGARGVGRDFEFCVDEEGTVCRRRHRAVGVRADATVFHDVARVEEPLQDAGVEHRMCTHREGVPRLCRLQRQACEPRARREAEVGDLMDGYVRRVLLYRMCLSLHVS